MSRSLGKLCQCRHNPSMSFVDSSLTSSFGVFRNSQQAAIDVCVENVWLHKTGDRKNRASSCNS